MTAPSCDDPGWDDPGWDDPAGRADAETWITAVVEAAGGRVDGELEARVRPWSTVVRVPATVGLLWFKASAPRTSYEPALVTCWRASPRWCTPR